MCKMRIYIALMVIGMSISISIAAKESPKETTVKVSATKGQKSSTPGENRGKRTLANLEYPSFTYSLDFPSRREGSSHARSFYSQDGLYNGQSATGQYSFADSSNHLPEYSQYPQYPRYLEAPEPIIEIIIKDSNETIPTEAPKPLIQKKKKEKIHVYYVKYKKDENNKLHLEEPIASLNNNESEGTEEEEEIIHYPTIVTPIPPLKTTTLRTIIHPDSEKFHSNSGIHVTFGSEDKSQSGHELQEHDAESVQRSVVALPQGVSFPPKPAPTANVRADFGDPRRPTVDGYQGFQNSFYQNYNIQPDFKPSLQQQHLPQPQALTAFRPKPQAQPQASQQNQNFQNYQPQPQSQPITHFSNIQQQNQQQKQYQQQQQQQRPFYHQNQNQPPSQYQRPSISTPLPPVLQYQNYQQQNVYHQQQQLKPQPQQQQQQQQQQQHQQQQQQHHHFQYSQQNHQQQYQQKPILQQQQSSHLQNYQQHPVSQPAKQLSFFPTVPPNSSDFPTRQSPTSYQPIKFRPTPVPGTLKQDASSRPSLSQAPAYSRPQSFIQKPAFSSPIPPQESPFDISNRYQKPQVQKSSNSRPAQNYNPLPHNHKPQYSSFNQSPSPNLGLDQLQNFFDVRPSKETELLKAIPKYEQHITETSDGHRYSSYVGGNQAIHDIPAPNLGPTTPSTSIQSTISGQYNNGDFGVQRQQFNSFVSSPNPLQYQSSTPAPQYVKTNDGQQLQIVTPMPSTSFYNQNQQPQTQFISSGSQPQIIPNSQPKLQTLYHQQPRQSQSSQFSVSTLHSDVFKELEHRKNTLSKDNVNIQPKNNYQYQTSSTTTSTTPASSTTSKNAAKASLELPDEVPDELRQQLLTSGILDNADISVLDYDKVGDIALENLPAEHLQHFYGAGGGAQISESNKVLTVVKTNGDSVNLAEKQIEKVKETKTLPHRQNVDLKVVKFNSNNEKSVTDKYIKSDSTVVPPIDLTDRQYSRYLPLKINGAQFPIPDVEELQGKKVASVVVLAPVDNLQGLDREQAGDGRSERDTADSKEIKFISGDIIKQLIKKPTGENFRKWLEKESHTDVDNQSVVLLVAKSFEEGQEIFMYDIATGAVNKLNGELSTAFVSVAEENASAENLDHASTLDPSILENMMEKKTKV